MGAILAGQTVNAGGADEAGLFRHGGCAVTCGAAPTGLDPGCDFLLVDRWKRERYDTNAGRRNLGCPGWRETANEMAENAINRVQTVRNAPFVRLGSMHV